MKQKILPLLAALALAAGGALPAAAADGAAAAREAGFAVEDGMIKVTEDIRVSASYDWFRFAGEGVSLNVYNWGLYISDGSDDSVDVLSAFEELTGIDINYTTFDSNESLYAKTKSGGASYDVIIPSDYMVGRMAAEGMLAELDYGNIPNYAKVGENYKGLEFDPESRYSVPYMWGMTGLIYNQTLVEEPPAAWADLWDARYAGQILMFNNSRDAYAIAAKKLGLSLNPSSVEEIAQGMEALKAQKNLVQAYVMDEIFDKMEGGEAALAPYYAGDAITMIADNPDLAFVYPREGSNFYVDSMCVPATSQNREAAEMFINYMCETDVGIANCEVTGYSTPITEVWENLDDELKYSPIAYPDDAVMAKSEVFITLPASLNQLMDTGWSDMKSYEEGGSGWMVVGFLVVAVLLAGFNIWRKMRAKMRSVSY